MTQLDRVTWVNEIIQGSQKSPVGKHLPNAFYVHLSALSVLPQPLPAYEQQARIFVAQDVDQATLIKFNFSEPKVSYLFYPTFDQEAHPPLQASLQVDLLTFEVSYRSYHETNNPPILHRKEAFVTPEYPRYQDFVQLTQQEVALGLLSQARYIGTKREWEQRLRDRALEIKDHQVICHEAMPLPLPKIERHKAAIVRHQLSRPVRVALEAQLFTPETTFFDYGCGQGGDVQRVREQGYPSQGWDPYYHPDTPLIEADIVNLGYVINVIEDTQERREALLKAWQLTRQVLIVSAQVLINDSAKGQVAYGDGVITRRNTFQKYYEQEELKAYIDQVLEVDAVPIGLGIYLVFRDQTQAETFRASQFRSKASTPRLQQRVRRFEDYQVLLTPLMDFMTERGRLPAKGELAEEAQIKAELGGLRRAFRVILQATNQEDWNAIAQQRTEELKLYLATALLTHRPKLKDFSPTIQQDIKGLFGTFKHACAEAEAMLFTLGDQAVIEEKINQSPVGLKLGKSLLVHLSSLDELDPLLRLYEACASRTIGRLEAVTVIQFYIGKPKIAYLSYPEFDRDPHPALQAKMEINLGDLNVHYTEYEQTNPLILHQKEKLVSRDYPLYEKFARLTKQERDWGLLDNLKAIRDRRGWLKCLEAHGAELKGYQLRWRKDLDPYRLKILKNQVQQRRRTQTPTDPSADQ
ncbi:MAG: DNA phosphorothioation-associated putative methyltransferase [Cyanobacteria bacterium]|jgi:DNA phosphorothioation-associated putative methyltransferase|nr:DNA phosphorothioation-associated putative methyltransferase [Cyanobacteria bacterium GSL.Bin21]